MSEDPIGDESTPPPELRLVPRDVSFEQPLDETAPTPEPVHDGDGFKIPSLGGERRDIIPGHLRTRKGVQSTAYKYFDAARFHSLFHLVRSPSYLFWGVVWACVGAARIAEAQRQWWWVSEQSFLRSKAVVDGNSPEWRALHGARPQDQVVARGGHRRRGVRDRLDVHAHRVAGPVVGVADRRRGGDAAVGPQG